MKEIYFTTSIEGNNLIDEYLTKGYSHINTDDINIVKQDVSKSLPESDDENITLYVHGLQVNEEDKTFVIFLKTVRVWKEEILQKMFPRKDEVDELLYEILHERNITKSKRLLQRKLNEIYKRGERNHEIKG